MQINEMDMKITEINIFMHESLDKKSKITDNVDKLNFSNGIEKIEAIKNNAIKISKEIENFKNKFDDEFNKYRSEKTNIDNIFDKYK